jgi:hypothetical protein
MTLFKDGVLLDSGLLKLRKVLKIQETLMQSLFHLLL